MTKFIFISFVLIFVSCNPLRQATKKEADLEKLVDKVTASRVIVPKDSSAVSTGTIEVRTDTMRINDTTNKIERFYYTTHSARVDTIKFFTRDMVRETALDHENVRNAALYNASLIIVADKEKWIKRLAIALGAFLILNGLIIAFKLFHK